MHNCQTNFQTNLPPATLNILSGTVLHPLRLIFHRFFNTMHWCHLLTTVIHVDLSYLWKGTTYILSRHVLHTFLCLRLLPLSSPCVLDFTQRALLFAWYLSALRPTSTLYLFHFFTDFDIGKSVQTLFDPRCVCDGTQQGQVARRGQQHRQKIMKQHDKGKEF